VRCCDVRFLVSSLASFYSTTTVLISSFVLGTCLDCAAKVRRVAERNAALEKASEGINSLWSDP
jgi:hypothetical protein